MNIRKLQRLIPLGRDNSDGNYKASGKEYGNQLHIW